MSRRDMLRARRQKQNVIRRVIAIIGVVAIAAFAVFVLVLPGIKTAQNARATQTALNSGTITVITPEARQTASHGTSLGDPNAPVKMDVWEDFQCSGCKSYSDGYEQPIIQKYVDTGKVYYTFHFEPFIDGGQGESHQAANAAMCANAQGKFWEYHDFLFANWIGENQGSFTNARLVAIAKQLKLDMNAFNQCFQSSQFSAQIEQDAQAGKAKGVPPTPGIFVNGVMVVSSQGPTRIPSVDDISKAIDAALGNQ